MPRLQVALDLIASEEAVALLRRIGPAVDLVEAGTPMIKREGMAAVARLRAAVPDKLLAADMKAADGGAYEAELAFDAGADLMTVLGCASDETVRATVAVATQRGRRIVADLLGVADKAARARQLAALGVDYLGVHAGTDEQASGASPLADLALLRDAVPTPLVVAGGIGLANLDAVLAYAPAIVVVGSAITRAPDPVAAAFAFRAALAGERGGV